MNGSARSVTKHVFAVHEYVYICKCNEHEVCGYVQSNIPNKYILFRILELHILIMTMNFDLLFP
jgi:hypothetical protein